MAQGRTPMTEDSESDCTRTHSAAIHAHVRNAIVYGRLFQNTTLNLKVRARVKRIEIDSDTFAADGSLSKTSSDLIRFTALISLSALFLALSSPNLLGSDCDGGSNPTTHPRYPRQTGLHPRYPHPHPPGL